MGREHYTQHERHGRAMRVGVASLVTLLTAGGVALAAQPTLAESTKPAKSIRYVAPKPKGKSWDVFRQRIIEDAQHSDVVATMMETINEIDSSDLDTSLATTTTDTAASAATPSSSASSSNNLSSTSSDTTSASTSSNTASSSTTSSTTSGNAVSSTPGTSGTSSSSRSTSSSLASDATLSSTASSSSSTSTDTTVAGVDADEAFTVDDAQTYASPLEEFAARYDSSSSTSTDTSTTPATSGDPTTTIGGTTVTTTADGDTVSPYDATANTTTATTTDSVISTIGFTLTDQQRIALEAQINTFSLYGYDVSFMMVDVDSGAALAYNPDQQLYSASTIKAPYLFSVFSTGALDLDQVVAGEDFQSQVNKLAVQQTLEYSDNKAYEYLFNEAGYAVFNTWAVDTGAPNAGILYTLTPYEFISVRDMAKLWTRGYGFMFKHQNYGDADPSSASREWLASEMTNSSNSTIHMALSEKYPVYTKAGWINGDENSNLYALNDAGIVEADSGTYLLVVLSTAANQHGLLINLISTIDDVHTQSFADESTPSQPFYAALRGTHSTTSS